MKTPPFPYALARTLADLHAYTRADDPAFMQPPAVEEFATDNLGPGLKVLGYSRASPQRKQPT
jgi:hypothetical protein